MSAEPARCVARHAATDPSSHPAPAQALALITILHRQHADLRLFLRPRVLQDVDEIWQIPMEKGAMSPDRGPGAPDQDPTRSVPLVHERSEPFLALFFRRLAKPGWTMVIAFWIVVAIALFITRHVLPR